MAWIYQVAFLFASRITETEGGKNWAPSFLFLPFSSQKEGHRAHLKLVTDGLLLCFRQVRSACGWLGNHSWPPWKWWCLEELGYSDAQFVCIGVAVLILITNALYPPLTRAFTPLPLPQHTVAL